ncbi:MAG: hypothetical protein PQJ46_04475, partial [Spirochaetales bacterium]|nr:hypothetical protein [Spirochaetales bacterium]
MRADYLIYKRTLKNGKSYNVKFWNQETQCYDKRYSIGSLKNQLGDKALNISTTSKAGANAIVRIWLKEGKPQKSGEIISEYLSKFWKEDSDYVKSKKIRGRSLSSDYLHNSFICIEKHVIPFLRNCGKEGIYLSQVTPGLLEKLLTSLSENNNLSSRRINAIYQAVTVPLAEAERLGIISNNPAKRVQKLTEKKPERKILTPGEVKAFFGIVPEDLRLYGINMLAATTGMRLGECRGLKRQCLHDTWIEIKYNWQDSEGLKSPKWGSERIVPVPTKTMEILDDLSKKNPWG